MIKIESLNNDEPYLKYKNYMIWHFQKSKSN